MKENKYILVSIEFLSLATIASLAFTILNTEYLFRWVAYNWKFYLVLCIVALLLIYLNKRFVSLFMTIGITTGTFLGNYLGAEIKKYNESKITEAMNAEEVYRLQHHPGFEIWIGVILLSIAIGVIMQTTLRKNTIK